MSGKLNFNKKFAENEHTLIFSFVLSWQRWSQSYSKAPLWNVASHSCIKIEDTFVFF